MFGHIYEGRRVFVTGHTGFKGSWLTAWLLQMGAEVAGFSDAVPTAPSHFDVIGLGGRIRDYRGDVRDRKALIEAMREFKPEIVFHLAAQALVRASYENPADTIEVNAMGTLNVLEAVRVTPSVEAVVSITSDKAYRNDEWVWGYRETDHLGGYDPYSASKGCAEIIAHSYFKSFFGDPVNTPYCATTRAGNVIGGGDWAADRIVPDCARAWSEGREVEIRSPHATRPWQHVLEPLSGYLWLGAKLFAAHRDAVKSGKGDGCHEGFRLDGEAFNFGPSSDASHTVADVVRALERSGPVRQQDGFGGAGRDEGMHPAQAVLRQGAGLPQLARHAGFRHDHAVYRQVVRSVLQGAGRGHLRVHAVADSGLLPQGRRVGAAVEFRWNPLLRTWSCRIWPSSPRTAARSCT